MVIDRAPRRDGNVWLRVVLLVGIVLTTANFVLFVVLATSDPPEWLWSMLSLSPWGPIALGAWIFITRHQKRTRYLQENGLALRATLGSIGSTASQYGGRPVLRLNLTVQGTTGPYEATVRTAPPYHLAGALRPGISLPVKAHPEKPERLLIDWAAVERETPPSVPR